MAEKRDAELLNEESRGSHARQEATGTEGQTGTDEQGEHLTAEEQERLALEEENERLRKELELMREKNFKERLYDHVHVSVRTMDIFIGIMLALLVFVVVLGPLNK